MNRTRTVRCVLALLLLPCAASAVDFYKASGWTAPLEYAPPVMAEAEAPGVRVGDRVFTLRESSPSPWEERAVLHDLAPNEVADPVAYLATLSGRASIDCADFVRSTVFDETRDGMRKLVELWTCPRYAKTDRGSASLETVLVTTSGGLHLSTMGEYAAFAPGRSVVKPEQEQRWRDFSKHLAICSGFDNPGCWPDADALVRADVATVSGAEQTALETIESRGAELYRQDQLAWHASDIVQADPRVKNFPVTAGWVAVPAQDRAGEVVFFRKDGSEVFPLWRVQFDANGSPTHELYQGTPPVSPLTTRLRAVETATRAYASRCNGAVNHSVMADDQGKGWIVYLLPSTSQSDTVMLGDGARLFVSADGA
ncbi:MAG: hypothetical protein ABI411_21295, partial [Tahibacter sp.]